MAKLLAQIWVIMGTLKLQILEEAHGEKIRASAISTKCHHDSYVPWTRWTS